MLPNSSEESGEQEGGEDWVHTLGLIQDLAISGFKKIETHLREIQASIGEMEHQLGDLTQRVQNLEMGYGAYRLAGQAPSDDETIEKLKEAAKNIGEKVRAILAKRGG